MPFKSFLHKNLFIPFAALLIMICVTLALFIAVSYMAVANFSKKATSDYLALFKKGRRCAFPLHPPPWHPCLHCREFKLNMH